MRGARRKVSRGRGWPRRCRWATAGTRGGRGDRGLRHGWRGTRWGGAELVTVPAASPGAIKAGLLGCHRNRRAHGAWSGPGELHLKAGWARVAWPRGLPGAILVPPFVAEGPFQASVYLVVPWRCNLTWNISKELKAGVPALSHQDGGDTPAYTRPASCLLPTRVPARGIVSPAISVSFPASSPTSAALETDAELELRGPQRDLASVPGEPWDGGLTGCRPARPSLCRLSSVWLI